MDTLNGCGQVRTGADRCEQVQTLVDVFRSLESQRGEFVIHDDGYRVRRFSYAQVTRAARGFFTRISVF